MGRWSRVIQVGLRCDLECPGGRRVTADAQDHSPGLGCGCGRGDALFPGNSSEWRSQRRKAGEGHAVREKGLGSPMSPASGTLPGRPSMEAGTQQPQIKGSHRHQSKPDGTRASCVRARL